MLPEQLLKARAHSQLKRLLPKGSFLWQPIETSTSVGVPDIFLSISSAAQRSIVRSTPGSQAQRGEPVMLSIWLEAKTLNYRISSEQLNWASIAHRAGTNTLLLTACPPYSYLPSASSHTIPLAYPYTVCPERHSAHQTTSILAMPEPSLCNADGITNEKSHENIVLMALDDRMLDFSTLGSYVRKVRPQYILFTDWLVNR